MTQDRWGGGEPTEAQVQAAAAALAVEWYCHPGESADSKAEASTQWKSFASMARVALKAAAEAATPDASQPGMSEANAQNPNTTAAELLAALKPFAIYYDQNDLSERHDDDDALEIPVRDIRRAADAYLAAITRAEARTVAACRPDEAGKWIEWSGGPNPVQSPLVDIKYADGRIEYNECADAHWWAHQYRENQAPLPGNIIAYRLAASLKGTD